MRAMLMILTLAMAPVALAKAPAGQGKTCDAKNRCDGALQCVKHRDGRATCEQLSVTPKPSACAAAFSVTASR